MTELPKRVERVRLLLLSLNDPYPTPRGAVVPDPGPAASKYLPCETCRSSGEVRARGGWILCLICDGTGWKRRTDEPEYDAYLGMRVEDALKLQATPSPPRVRDPDVDEGYGWERALEAHDRHGSYSELRRWLDWLALANPRRYRLVRLALVDHEGVELSAAAQLEVDLGVIQIALRMRSVRVPYWLRDPEAQPDTIESLAALGMGAGEIARKLGMSKRAVRRKLKGKQVGSAVAGIPLGAM